MKHKGRKILIIRFSSIGDIVLTTPVIRCIKQQIPGARVHYVTKDAFKNILANNPYIDRLYTFKKSLSELYQPLSDEKYDVVIDLHKNTRSMLLKRKLKVRESYAFNKINFQKFIAVRLKALGILPQKHIVDRFFEAIAPLGIVNDNKGLDYFIGEADVVNAAEMFFHGHVTNYIALVVGGSYYTKKIPLSKLEEICGHANLPVILLGGNEDREIAASLKKKFPQVISCCGELTVSQSASVIQQAEWVITSDTGLMHIAAAYGKKIISAWGNTIPDFGMSPYLPNPDNITLEIHHLKCRPCSKLGFKKCPQGHFRCMLDIDYSFVNELE